MHVTCDPAILYFGTPVVLVGSTNEDGTPNLAPMSSAWWLGQRCLLGFAKQSKTPQNLRRTGECVLNLPSASQVDQVDRLARTTGSNPVPAGKLARGYRHEPDKFGCAGLTPLPGETVAAPRAAECPVQLEAVVEDEFGIAGSDPIWRDRHAAIAVRVTKVHVDSRLICAGEPNRIDPDQWRPLIMSFQQFYGLEDERLRPSTLAKIPEALYRPN